jgi:hypothetical protein
LGCLSSSSSGSLFLILRINQLVVKGVQDGAGSPDNRWQWPQEVLATRGAVQGQTINARPCLTINKLPQHVRQQVLQPGGATPWGPSHVG